MFFISLFPIIIPLMFGSTQIECRDATLGPQLDIILGRAPPNQWGWFSDIIKCCCRCCSCDGEWNLGRALCLRLGWIYRLVIDLFLLWFGCFMLFNVEAERFAAGAKLLTYEVICFAENSHYDMISTSLFHFLILS